MTAIEKVCHACKQTKPASDFYKSSNSKDGLAPSCKDCQNGRTPITTTKVVPGTLAQSMRKTAKLEALAPKRDRPTPTQTPNTQGSIPLEEPEEIEQQDEHLKSHDWVWWKDPDRKQYGHPDRSWYEPRAANIVSINNENGTALVEYYQDPTCERKEVRSLAKISDLRRRPKIY